jgi:hypothetical protein
MPNLNSPWRLTATTADLHCGPLTGRIDLAAPQLGLTALTWNNQEESGAIWQLTPVEPIARIGGLEDAYIRGEDLVATYRPGPNFPYRLEVYWSVSQHESAVLLRGLVSIQTPLLDTNPEVEVATYLATSSLAINNWAFREQIHPDDAAPGANESSGKHTLFGHFMEKGVIRRVRLFAAFAPQAEQIDTLYANFLSAPLPLTT